MSWVYIYVHVVFSTKDWYPYLNKDIRKIVFKHIKKNAQLKGINITEINGFTDHCHCLLILSKEQSISKTVQLIKGESSYWINKHKLTNKHFGWQDDYWAVSVSKSHLRLVKRYIRNQEEHHKRTTFSQEIEELLMKIEGKGG